MHKTPAQKTKLLYILAILLAATATLVAYPKLSFLSSGEFNRTEWLQFDETDLSLSSRQPLIEPFLNQPKFRNATRQVLIEILGEPSTRKISVCDLSYVLGWERSGYGVDSEWLCISLGSPENTLKIITD